jgi:hypothetical protein
MGGSMRRLPVMVLLCVACSTSNPISIDQLGVEGAKEVCEFQTRCGNARDLAACLSVLSSGPTSVSATVLAGVKAGRIKYDGNLARDCVDALSSRSCDITTASYHGYPQACLSTFQGTLHSGATCANSGECISQSCDMPACNMACCTGTCQGDDPPVLAKAGASCAINLCEPEAFCDLTSMTCMPLKKLGESCPRGFTCAEGLYCLGSTKTCGPLPKLGEPCGNNGCRDRGATCSATTGTCVKVGVLGDPCTQSGEECSDLYVCDANNQCSAGIALGAPCKMFEQCANAEAFCDIPDNATMGVCTAPKPNGASCRGHFDCASDVCDPASSTCVADVPCD